MYWQFDRKIIVSPQKLVLGRLLVFSTFVIIDFVNGKMSGQPFKLLPDQWTKQAITEHIIIHYRWVFVMFLLPISLGYDIYMALRSYVVFKLNSGI